MTEELKPCPFCGGKADAYTAIDGWQRIECHGCHITTPASAVWMRLVKKWNRRVNE